MLYLLAIMAGNQTLFDEAMRKGHSAAWDQQWSHAIACYRAALQEIPTDPNALTSMGFALLQTKRLDEALGVYQRAASLNPGDPVAPEKCGEIFEQLGRINEAVQTYLIVAEIHLKRRDVDKAVDNWNRVVYLAPDNLAGHSRLALALERTGKTQLAVQEYLEVARLCQQANEIEKAFQTAQHARQLEPQSAQVREALERLNKSQPVRSTGKGTGMLRPLGTGMLTKSEAQELNLLNTAKPETGPLRQGTDRLGTGRLGTGPIVRQPSPLTLAQETAVAALAELLFEDDTDTSKTSGSMSALTRGTGSLRDGGAQRAQAIMYLGQAIGHQTNNEPEAALSNYTSALSAGLESHALYFMVGSLSLDFHRPKDAIKYLSAATARPDIAPGAHFGLAEAYQHEGQSREALASLLEALKQIDFQLAEKSELQDKLAEAYESLTETLLKSAEAEVSRLVASIQQLLSGPDWAARVRQARQNLSASAEAEDEIAPLANLFAEAGTDQLIEAMHVVREQMKLEHWTTAMDEAYQAIHLAPLYMPAHIRMAEILSADNKIEAAIAKYTVISEAYWIRGETMRAARIMQEVLRLNPLDVSGRTRLIQLLVEQKQMDGALSQYLDLADTYYQLANLEEARAAYVDALALAQRVQADRSWLVRLYHHLGDIDMQRLAWRDALQAYTQINTLSAFDEKARQAVVELHFRIGDAKAALTALDSYLRQLLQARNMAKAISVLEELAHAYTDEPGVLARLAKLYQDQGRKADAIAQYDRLADLQTRDRQTAQAAETLRTILALGPNDPTRYQRRLAQLQSG